MFTRINDALEWITSIRSPHHSFVRFKQLCHELDDPQNGFYTIHVTGTDGKGSTCCYLRDLLMSQGFKVGTLTSPHYITHLDRIRLNGSNISDEAFLRILNEHYDFFVEKKLSMFEMDFLIMCQYFREEKVDMAIVEVGIGGLEDTTNVIDDTALAIITSIGYDHMNILGDTLEEICYQKCGIIKDGCKVLIGDDLSDECLSIVKQEAAKHHSAFYQAEAYEDLGPRRFGYQGFEYEISSYAVYQKHNAVLALKALDIISADRGLRISQDALKEALRTSLWKGRFEIVHEDPLVILDGAHNIHGIAALCESFDQFSGSKCIVFSALKRKEYQQMAKLLKQHCQKLIITSFDYSEVIDLSEFGEYETVQDYHEAIRLAMKEYDNVLICGSLYLLSEVVQNVNFN